MHMENQRELRNLFDPDQVLNCPITIGMNNVDISLVALLNNLP